ncbi:phosphopantetheine-binding protein, partial [Actinoallomurus acaciae]
RLVRAIGPREPAIPFVPSSAPVTDPAYWAASAGEERDEALAGLLAGPGRILVEIGTGTRLADLARRRPEETGRHLLLSTPGERSLFFALGHLWLAGAPVSSAAVHEGRRPDRVPLPTYPFERRRYLVEPAGPQPERLPDPPGRPADRPVGPVTPELIAGLFAEILDLPEVEPDESFFDLGGDSLIAARLLARAREIFPVDLATRAMFEAPTPAELAALIGERMADDPPAAGRAP